MRALLAPASMFALLALQACAVRDRSNPLDPAGTVYAAPNVTVQLNDQGVDSSGKRWLSVSWNERKDFAGYNGFALYYAADGARPAAPQTNVGIGVRNLQWAVSSNLGVTHTVWLVPTNAVNAPATKQTIETAPAGWRLENGNLVCYNLGAGGVSTVEFDVAAVPFNYASCSVLAYYTSSSMNPNDAPMLMAAFSNQTTRAKSAASTLTSNASYTTSVSPSIGSFNGATTTLTIHLSVSNASASSTSTGNLRNQVSISQLFINTNGSYVPVPISSLSPSDLRVTSSPIP